MRKIICVINYINARITADNAITAEVRTYYCFYILYNSASVSIVLHCIQRLYKFVKYLIIVQDNQF